MTRKALLTLAFTLTLNGPSLAEGVNTGYFGNVAIEGYDPVAYFTEGRAVRGNMAHAYDWLGAEWHFANASNLALFVADPISYMPQFGGMCADGIAYDTMTVNIDPELFSIIDGKLYLFFDPGALEEFEQTPGFIEQAEDNWPRIRQSHGTLTR